jgi:ABC-type uncharacterized transport system permease subunit
MCKQWTKCKSYLKLVAAYIRLNCNIQLEYKGAFVSQFAAMFLNNSAWLAFWLLFLTASPGQRL